MFKARNCCSEIGTDYSQAWTASVHTCAIIVCETRKSMRRRILVTFRQILYGPEMSTGDGGEMEAERGQYWQQQHKHPIPLLGLNLPS